MKISFIKTAIIFTSSISILVAQEMRTVTPASGALTVSENAIVQVVGVMLDTEATTSYLPSIQCTYADGTIVTNQLGETVLTGGASGVTSRASNSIVGNVYTGITKIQITRPDGSNTQVYKAAVTIKIMTQASEVVSTPMVLPAVDDANYVIALETSVDMQNWVPSYPGEYLGNGSHRFFRVKSTRKPSASPAAK